MMRALKSLVAFVCSFVLSHDFSNELVPVGRSLHAAPIFIKMHKVGSSSVSLHIECWSKALRWEFIGMKNVTCKHERNASLLLPGDKYTYFQKQWMNMNGMLSGPWNHDATVKYSSFGLQMFDHCMHLRQVPSDPLPKLLVMFRDPVERFFSYMQFFATKVVRSKRIWFTSVLKWISSDKRIHATRLEIESWLLQWQGLNGAPLFEYEAVFGGERIEFDAESLKVRPLQKWNNKTQRSISITRAKERLNNEMIVGILEHMDESLVLFMLSLNLKPPTFCSPLGNVIRARVEVSRGIGKTHAVTTAETVSHDINIKNRETFRSRCDPQFLEDLEELVLSTEIAIYKHALSVHKEQVRQLDEKHNGIHEYSLTLMRSKDFQGKCQELQNELEDKLEPILLEHKSLRDKDMSNVCSSNAELIRKKWDM